MGRWWMPLTLLQIEWIAGMMMDLVGTVAGYQRAMDLPGEERDTQKGIERDQTPPRARSQPR